MSRWVSADRITGKMPVPHFFNGLLRIFDTESGLRMPFE